MSTVSCAPLHTAKMKSPSTCFIRSNHAIQTSTFSTSKLLGVPGARTMIKRVVSTHTIGKTWEESHLCTTMRETYAATGKLIISFGHILMAAPMSTDANTVTDGKNSNTTLETIRSTRANSNKNARSIIVLTITRKRTVDSLLARTSNCCRRTEAAISVKTIHI